MKPGRAVASFDSATGMLRALSNHLAGRDTPALGQVPNRWEPAVSAALGAVNHLPTRAAERLYAAAGVSEAVPRDALGDLDADELAHWVVDHYPRRQYPVVFIGSSNGALIHLAAALDAPWLPQTLLVPVRRRGVDRDDARAELDAGMQPARELLDANPELVLHHMHDPNQDRLMIAGMSYFRVKWNRLPRPYRRFLREHLAPGGVVISVECELTWPVTRVDDRHVFQFGALGGATAEEYHHGGPRVAEFLNRYGASRRSWNPPPADTSAPEAEWGFEPGILDDLDTAASQDGFTRRGIRFPHPEALSGPVADLHRDQYRRRGLPTDRLLVESFLLVEPWWALRTGSVPFWTAFNTQGSHDSLAAHLDERAPYDEIRLLLFSHGTDSIGLATAAQWHELARRARTIATLTGVDADAYPRDFAVLARAHRELARTRHVHDMPPPLDLDTVEPVLRSSPEVALTA